MSFTDAVRTCLSNYAEFNGRARRSEFWWFVLFYNLVGLPFAIVGLILFLGAGVGGDQVNNVLLALGITVLALGVIVQLAIVVPMLAVGSRRLHDMGQTGWWQLLLLLGGCGAIVLIVLWVMDTFPSENVYGPPPA